MAGPKVDEVGRIFGLSQSEGSNIERGKSRQIDASLARGLEKFYGHPIQELLSEIIVISKSRFEYLVLNENRPLLVSLKGKAKKSHMDENVLKNIDEAMRVINKELKKRNLKIQAGDEPSAA